mmetsp:Transcript_59327/g.180919  ORF Transcript_59327/g.180919 Transcript_59327/m.180919 type:complete len:348 (+) Transcript_59327:2353-3396(+)
MVGVRHGQQGRPQQPRLGVQRPGQARHFAHLEGDRLAHHGRRGRGRGHGCDGGCGRGLWPRSFKALAGDYDKAREGLVLQGHRGSRREGGLRQRIVRAAAAGGGRPRRRAGLPGAGRPRPLDVLCAGQVMVDRLYAAHARRGAQGLGSELPRAARRSAHGRHGMGGHQRGGHMGTAPGPGPAHPRRAVRRRGQVQRHDHADGVRARGRRGRGPGDRRRTHRGGPRAHVRRGQHDPHGEDVRPPAPDHVQRRRLPQDQADRMGVRRPRRGDGRRLGAGDGRRDVPTHGGAGRPCAHQAGGFARRGGEADGEGRDGRRAARRPVVRHPAQHGGRPGRDVAGGLCPGVRP